uniref:RxLR effector candidate protein n=1 Tax=Hyaloperonospora arabidopsidis (strain Emoy2) TaxID=559515 RepID=M4B397_HYAAE
MVLVLLLTPGKRLRIATSCALLLRRSRGYLLRECWIKWTSTGARFKLHRLSRDAGLPCLSWGDACQSCVNNLARAPKEAYSMNDPWWRVRVTQEIYEEIANLQSLYKRAGRSFPDGPSSASDAPCRTARQGPKHQLAVESEAPNYLPRVDTHATGRGKSSDVPSHRGGSTIVPRGSVGHRAHQSMNEAEEKTGSQTGLQVQTDAVSQIERVTCELREDFEHERSRRLGLVDNVTRVSLERERDRSDLAFAQLENEPDTAFSSRRASGSSSGYLSASRGDIRASDSG